MLDELLTALRRGIPGTRAVLLVDSDGMVVAGEGDVDSPWELVGAASADLVRRAVSAHAEAGLAPPAELSWASGSGTLLYRAVTDDYGLLVALGRDGLAGRARWLMRHTAVRLLPEL